MADLQDYYDEHADHARQHEDQRERVTNIILSIAGVLVGLVTFAEMSLWALPAALSLVLLGVYGYFFSGKHYERFRFHSAILLEIRAEMDRLAMYPAARPRPFALLRRKGREKHYRDFRWPRLFGSSDPLQGRANSWIARQRLHIFWELVHILVALLGIGLCVAIGLKDGSEKEADPIKVEIVNQGSTKSNVIRGAITAQPDASSGRLAPPLRRN
jgi:hypothetical protein